MSRFLSAEQAAELSGVHPKTVRRWIASGRLRAGKRGRAYRIRLEDLAPFMEQEGEHPDNGEHAGHGTGDIGDRGQSGPSGQDGLLEMIRELQAQVVQYAATAAMWQARAELLAHQLGEAQGRIRMLEAPKEPEPAPVPEPLPPTPDGRELAPPWRRVVHTWLWLGIVICALIVAYLLMQAAYMLVD
jgi:excisionase family DNA binding protein